MSYYADRSAAAPNGGPSRSAPPPNATDDSARPTPSTTSPSAETGRAGRERLASRSLTFAELLASNPIKDPAVLRHVLREEVRSGRVRFHPPSRYALNGGLPDDVKLALSELRALAAIVAESPSVGVGIPMKFLLVPRRCPFVCPRESAHHSCRYW